MPIYLTRTVKHFLIISGIVFFIQQTGDQFFGTHLFSWLALTPSLFLSHFYFWQLFTFPFVHSDVMRLFFDLMMLAFIGSELESLWGRARFVRYYFFCTGFAGLIYVLLQQTLGLEGAGPLFGTSAAIYGYLMAYGLIFGERVLLFMMLFPMKAKHFIWVLAALEFFTSLYSRGSHWSSIAQLSGMFAGLLYMWMAAYLSRKTRLGTSGAKKVKKKRSKHLKLVVNNDNGDFDVEDSEHEPGPKTWH